MICQKERTPLPRAGWNCVSPSLASHPQVFHGGCFGVYGTPPREAVWFCEIGTKIPLAPRLGVGTLRIRWLSWLTFGWRVQTCSQVFAWCLKTAPPGVCLAAWPRYRLQSMPGFFRAVRGSAMKAGVLDHCVGQKDELNEFGQKKALPPWSGEQGFRRKLGL